jgi:hypothetical protein
VLELRRRLAILDAPIKASRILAAGDIRFHLNDPASMPGTVWLVIWGVNAPLHSPTATLFDRLGYTTLLKIDSGPTVAANLTRTVDHLIHLVPPLPTRVHRLDVDFDDPPHIRLVGYTLPLALYAGQAVPITIVWQALTPISTDYTVFLHLRDPAGRTVAQLDYRPFEGAYPTSHWLPGSTVAETRQWQLPADLPPGPYTVQTGLYQLQTLARLPLIKDIGGENAVTLGQVWLE